MSKRGKKQNKERRARMARVDDVYPDARYVGKGEGNPILDEHLSMVISGEVDFDRSGWPPGDKPSQDFFDLTLRQALAKPIGAMFTVTFPDGEFFELTHVTDGTFGFHGVQMETATAITTRFPSWLARTSPVAGPQSVAQRQHESEQVTPASAVVESYRRDISRAVATSVGAHSKALVLLDRACCQYIARDDVSGTYEVPLTKHRVVAADFIEEVDLRWEELELPEKVHESLHNPLRASIESDVRRALSEELFAVSEVFSFSGNAGDTEFVSTCFEDVPLDRYARSIVGLKNLPMLRVLPEVAERNTDFFDMAVAGERANWP